MTDEIDIGYTPNCNAATTHMRRIDGDLKVTTTTSSCLNRFEVLAKSGMELDQINRACLHVALDEWLDDREEIMAG